MGLRACVAISNALLGPTLVPSKATASTYLLARTALGMSSTSTVPGPLDSPFWYQLKAFSPSSRYVNAFACCVEDRNDRRTQPRCAYCGLRILMATLPPKESVEYQCGGSVMPHRSEISSSCSSTRAVVSPAHCLLRFTAEAGLSEGTPFNVPAAVHLFRKHWYLHSPSSNLVILKDFSLSVPP